MTLVIAVITTVAVAGLPGYLLARALAPRLDPLVHVAISVPASAGLLYVSALWFNLLHLSVVWAVLLTALIAVAALWYRVRSGGGATSAWRTVPWPDLTAVLIAGLTLLTVWLAGMRSIGAVPPHDDGYHHGYWVARIMATGSIDPSVVTPLDPLTAEPGTLFYPWGTHLEAALVGLLSGADAATAFNLVVLLGTATALPTGLLVLTRRLASDSRWAPPAAALLGVTVPALSYAASWGGLFPQMLAMAALAGVALVADDYVESRRWTTLMLGATGLAGLTGLHPTVAAYCALVVVALTFTGRVRMSWSRRLIGGFAWLSVSGLCVLPAVIALPATWRGAQQTDYGVTTVSVGESLASLALLREYVTGPAPLAFTALAWVGAIVAVRAGRIRPWVALVGTLAVLFILAAIWRTSLVLLITSPWYSMPARMSPYLTYLLVPLAASVVGLISRRHKGREGPDLLRRTVIGTILALALVGGVTSSAAVVRDNYRDYSLIGSADRQAFEWLADRTDREGLVLNGSADGSEWLYALAGVPTTSWSKFTTGGGEPGERAWLAEHASRGWTDPRVAADLKRLRIHYAYVGDNVFPDDHNRLSGNALATSPNWRLVYQSGGARVFELLRPTG